MAQPKHRQSAPDPSEDRIRRLHEALRDVQDARRGAQEDAQRLQKIAAEVQKLTASFTGDYDNARKAIQSIVEIAVDRQVEEFHSHVQQVDDYFATRVEEARTEFGRDLAEKSATAKDTFARLLQFEDVTELVLAISDIVTFNIVNLAKGPEAAQSFLVKSRRSGRALLMLKGESPK